MKQIFALVVAFTITTTAFSQAGQKWSTSGNTTTSGDFIGSTNNEPLIFKTNNTTQGLFTTTGSFQLTNLAGTGFRLLQTDASGTISPFSMGGVDDVLYGDGTWRPLPTPPPSTWELNGTSLFYLNGKVGIGTKTPFTNFDVIGDAYISNNLYVGGGIIITEKINANKEVLTAALRADSIVMDSTKGIYGYSIFKDQVRLENKLQVVGNTQIDGNFRVNGDFIFGDNKRITYLPASGGNPEIIGFGGLPLPPSLDPCFSPTVTTTQFPGMIQTHGNSAYGGSTNILSMGFDGANGIIDMSGTNTQGGPALLINYYCGKDVAINTGVNGGNVVMTSATLGNVGIGTSTPTAKLDVVGGVTGSGDFISNGFMQSALGYKFPDGSIQTTSALSLGSQSNPFQEIYVNNYIKIGTNSLWLNSGTGGNNEIYTTNGALVINPVGVSVGGGPASTGQNTYINPTLGNVGIGTIDTYKMLTVNGDVSLANYNNSGGGNMGNGMSGLEILGMNQVPTRRGISLDSDPNGSFNFFINSNQTTSSFNFKNGNGTPTTLMTIMGNGNVGIGTNIPTQKLEVAHDDGVGASAGMALTNLSTANKNSEIKFNQGNTTLWAIGNDVTHSNKQDFFIFDNISYQTRFLIDANGKTGIGTGTPTQRLEVAHTDSEGGIAINQVDPTNTFKKSEIKFNLQGQEEWAIGSHLNGNDNSFFIWSHLATRTALYITENGKVNIGGLTIPPATSTYMLFVDGGIATRDVKVTNSASWPDYVFNASYPLMSIYDLKKFIEKNHHLPGITSAKEIEKNEGFELGDMQVKLVKQVEEQALYIIDLQKQLDEIKVQLNKLNSNNR